jgi:hypothetical protein
MENTFPEVLKLLKRSSKTYLQYQKGLDYTAGRIGLEIRYFIEDLSNLKIKP